MYIHNALNNPVYISFVYVYRHIKLEYISHSLININVFKNKLF